MAGLLGVLRYTERNNTIAVNGNDVTPEAINRSNGLLFATEATKLGIQLNLIAAAADGLIDGKRVHFSILASEDSLTDPSSKRWRLTAPPSPR